MTNTKPLNVYWIDLFCGAGGTSSGIHLASPNTKVIACVNHDANAIKSHELNHPEAAHFTEDIRDFGVVLKIKKIVNQVRADDPGCVIAIWASLECTNFSKAKGGLPRDADSRTLADHMPMYLRELDPDYFWVENVREFMSWGPLDVNGKPVSRTEMRMLNIDELKQIQGFPRSYKLVGTQTEQKKYIGNAVEVTQAKVLIITNYNALVKYYSKIAA